MAVNIAEIYSPDPFASGGTADAYKRRLLAAQLLQKKASEDDKVYSNSHGGMKLATALLGGMMEGWEERKAKQGQAAVGRDLASALASAGVSSGGMGGISAPSPSSPSSGSPAGAPSLAGGGASRAMATPGEPLRNVAVTDPDVDLAIRTVIGEAKGEGEEGWKAVAGVIRNRAQQSGKSLSDVVLAKNQFEPWGSRRRELEGIDPASPIYQRVAATILPVLQGEEDPTGGATHFYAPKAQRALGRRAPSWDDGSGFDIGNHRFFRLGYGGGGQHGIPSRQVDAPPAPAELPTTTEQVASADTAEAVKARTGVDWNNPVARQHMLDAGLTPPEGAQPPAQVASAEGFIPATDPSAPQDTSGVPYSEQVQRKNPAVQVAGPGASIELPPMSPGGTAAPSGSGASFDPETTGSVAPPPPPSPPERPRVPPQAMAQALMAGGAPPIDPNSNNAGAMQFAASGMGRQGATFPDSTRQSAPAAANPRQSAPAPAGMYGAPGQAPAPPAQVAASAPSQYAQAPAAQPQQPAMDPRAAHALRVINSPWATAGQISAAQGILKQLAPDVQLIPTADGHIIAVDKHNLGKGATPIYKAPEKGVVVEGEIRSPTAGTTIGPKREFRPLVTQADRDRYGIPQTDKRPYVVGPDNRPIVTPGDPSTNVNVGTGETEEQKERGKGLAKRINTIADDGDEAAKDLAVAQRLHQLGTNVDPGTKTALLDEIRARTGLALDPNADNVQAYKAMIAYMKPRMRVAGSGVSSDKDMAAFEQSLPSLLGTPGGNEIATRTIGGMAQFRHERGLLAQRWQLGEIDAKTFNAEIAKLPDPFATFKDWQKANGSSPQPDKDGWTTIDGVRIRRKQ
jgi:hypothetical protein